MALQDARPSDRPSSPLHRVAQDAAALLARTQQRQRPGPARDWRRDGFSASPQLELDLIDTSATPGWRYR